MDLENVRLIVRRKLVSGELPQDHISRFWGGFSNGEDCDVCEEPIAFDQLLVETISTATNQGLQFHIGCFYIWDEERDPPGRLDHVRRPPKS